MRYSEPIERVKPARYISDHKKETARVSERSSAPERESVLRSYEPVCFIGSCSGWWSANIVWTSRNRATRWSVSLFSSSGLVGILKLPAGIFLAFCIIGCPPESNYDTVLPQS